MVSVCFSISFCLPFADVNTGDYYYVVAGNELVSMGLATC